ncbi:unnamed protein product [Protopolystoma xenopodis]|uniref:Uncharacterized protein n=1 Tax=Protopolystoma xenopodis TaxID=117903 RepID=A0A3S5FF19_9PLAT|nr:unnamed protein product [Protopolystoma xenopodis]
MLAAALTTHGGDMAQVTLVPPSCEGDPATLGDIHFFSVCVIAQPVRLWRAIEHADKSRPTQKAYSFTLGHIAPTITKVNRGIGRAYFVRCDDQKSTLVQAVTEPRQNTMTVHST